MKKESQKKLKPTPYHPKRFKRNKTILIEIVIEIDKEGYNAIERVYIYANGLVKPAIKLHRKVFDSNWMGYKYHCIMEKPKGKERE